MVKANFRSKLDGNDLDLSLMSLEEVPVKEIAAIPKATNIDLSCNHLKMIPSPFCNLQQIVKLDLSKNSIESLPNNFGDLIKLQYLDLYNNKLRLLPLSFGQLKGLKWLDLKDNPLSPQLKAIAGDCLDAKQCQMCAKKVVQFMANVQNELRREEELAALRKIKEEEEENEQQRKAKKAAKEHKKAKLLAEKQAKLKRQKNAEDNHHNSELSDKSDDTNMPPTNVVKINKNSNSGGSGCLNILKTIFFFLAFAVTLTFGLLFIYTGGNFSQPNIQHAVDQMMKDVQYLISFLKGLIFKFWVWLQNDGVQFLYTTLNRATAFFKELFNYAGIILEDAMKILSHSWLHLMDRFSALTSVMEAS